MAEKTYQPGENYPYPLIIKKLLNTPLVYSPDREIVYDDRNRYTYRTLNERIQRLAGGLAQHLHGDAGAGLGRQDRHAVAVAVLLRGILAAGRPRLNPRFYSTLRAGA